MIAGKRQSHKHVLYINSIDIEKQDELLLFDIKIDNKSNFKELAGNLCVTGQWAIQITYMNMFYLLRKTHILGITCRDIAVFSMHYFLNVFQDKLLSSKACHRKTPNSCRSGLPLMAKPMSQYQARTGSLVSKRKSFFIAIQIH